MSRARIREGDREIMIRGTDGHKTGAGRAIEQGEKEKTE